MQIALLQTVLFGQGHTFVVGFAVADTDIKEIPPAVKDSWRRIATSVTHQGSGS